MNIELLRGAALFVRKHPDYFDMMGAATPVASFPEWRRGNRTGGTEVCFAGLLLALSQGRNPAGDSFTPIDLVPELADLPSGAAIGPLFTTRAAEALLGCDPADEPARLALRQLCPGKIHNPIARRMIHLLSLCETGADLTQRIQKLAQAWNEAEAAGHSRAEERWYAPLAEVFPEVPRAPYLPLRLGGPLEVAV